MTRTFTLLTVQHCEQIKRVVGYSLMVKCWRNATINTNFSHTICQGFDVWTKSLGGEDAVHIVSPIHECVLGGDLIYEQKMRHACYFGSDSWIHSDIVNCFLARNFRHFYHPYKSVWRMFLSAIVCNPHASPTGDTGKQELIFYHANPTWTRPQRWNRFHVLESKLSVMINRAISFGWQPIRAKHLNNNSYGHCGDGAR